MSFISPEFSTVPPLLRDVVGTTNTSGASVDNCKKKRKIYHIALPSILYY